MVTTDRYRTAVVAPSQRLADAVCAELGKRGHRAEVVKRKAWWIHTDARQEEVTALVMHVALHADFE